VADLLHSDSERFWARLRDEHFLLAPSRVFLNPGSLGVMPRSVLQAVTDSLTRGAEYRSDVMHRWGYEALEAERSEMSDFLGCRLEELAFTHNCTEAMSYIANGLELQAGDEVLTTNQEHPGGSACWKLRQARHGIVVREVEIPLTPQGPEELADRILSAISPRTRVLSFSGVTSPTGLVLPAKEICRGARERGLIVVLDGAHMDGQVPVNLRDLGCDYFAGSPHKWLFAPPGCGLLFGRDNLLDALWPSVVSAGWDNKAGLHAARFMMTGTNNRSTIDGMIAGLRFLRNLGESVTFARMHHLARLTRGLAARRDYLEVITPDDSRLFQAMVSIRFKTDPGESLWSALVKANIHVLRGQRLRLSTQVHTRPSDIETFFAVCDQVLAG
jgi:isopenicillin-N epimerase